MQQTVVAVGVHGIVSHGGFGWEVRKALTDEGACSEARGKFERLGVGSRLHFPMCLLVEVSKLRRVGSYRQNIC